MALGRIVCGPGELGLHCRIKMVNLSSHFCKPSPNWASSGSAFLHSSPTAFRQTE
jgi:hypothetical protein